MNQTKTKPSLNKNCSIPIYFQQGEWQETKTSKGKDTEMRGK